MAKEVKIFQMEKICGLHCVGVDEGEAFFKQILPLLKDGQSICLDFKNIETITSSFLNAAVGALYGQFVDDSFETFIAYENLDENDVQLVRLVIRNAKEHFKKSRSGQETENKIIKNSIEKQKDE
jgi:hypothetical protein